MDCLEGKVALSPRGMEGGGRGEDLKNWLGWLNNLAGSISSTRETPRGTPKWAHFELLTGRQSTTSSHWLPGPHFTEAIKAGNSGSGATRGIQDSVQQQFSHRAVIYTKQERADTLRQIVPPTHCWQNGQLFNQKLYITGNKLGGVGAWGTHPQYSQMNEQCLSGETQMPRPLNHNRSSL